MTLTRIDGYPMDLEVSAAISLTADVTSRPVETGAQITDHIRNNPEEVTLECIVSDTPIGEAKADQTRQIADGTILETPYGTYDTPLQSEDAYAKLIEIRRDKRLIAIDSVSLGRLDNMVLVDLSPKFDAETNGGLFFTAKFRRLVLVTNLRARVPVRSTQPGAGGKGKAKAKAGTKFEVDDKITWKHGSPPGSPWRAGLPIEVVRARRRDAPGLSRDGYLSQSALLATADLGSPGIAYFEDSSDPWGGSFGAEREITGNRRASLVADLYRDRNVAAGNQQAMLARARSASDAAHKLFGPLGMDLSRIQVGF